MVSPIAFDLEISVGDLYTSIEVGGDFQDEGPAASSGLPSTSFSDLLS